MLATWEPTISFCPLFTAKRSEEAIIFGNHQNFARVKKANPHPFPVQQEQQLQADDTSSSEEQEEDSKALIPEQLNAKGSDTETAQPGPSQSGDPTEDEEAQIEKLLTPDDGQEEGNEQQQEEDQEEKQQEEEMVLEKLMGQDQPPVEPVHSQGLPIAHPEQVLEKENPTLEEEEEEVASGDAEATLDDMEKPGEKITAHATCYCTSTKLLLLEIQLSLKGRLVVAVNAAGDFMCHSEKL